MLIYRTTKKKKKQEKKYIHVGLGFSEKARCVGLHRPVCLTYNFFLCIRGEQSLPFFKKHKHQQYVLVCVLQRK